MTTDAVHDGDPGEEVSPRHVARPEPPGAAAGDPPLAGGPAAGAGRRSASANDARAAGPRRSRDAWSPRRHPRPTSRRGRAGVRGRVPAAAPLGARRAGPQDDVPGAAPRRRGRGRLQRQRAALLAGMGALTLVGVGLTAAGVATVRGSTVGRYEQAVGPDDPGYQAQVVPTPTMAVIHRGAEGDLVGAAVLALEPDDDGGSVIVVPPAAVVAGEGGETTLDAIYRGDGADAAVDALATAVTVAIDDHVELGHAEWAELVAPVGPIEVTIDDGTALWPDGEVRLEASAVGPFLADLEEDETDLDRLARQRHFWNAWLPLVGGADDDALPGEIESGIGRFVRGIAGGDGVAVELPVTRRDVATGVQLRPDTEQLGDLVARTVPYPMSPEPGTRVRVRLLNGTQDDTVTPAVARSLVAAGAEITVVGNASSFDVDETAVLYTGADRATQAEWLGTQLDGARVEESAGGQDGVIASNDEIDVTVILGDDALDLIGR